MLTLRTWIKDDKGYILIGMLFIMLLVAVTALGMNRRAGMQARMAANQARSVQISLGQLAALEDAAWQLIQDPDWRTDPAGEDYFFSGVTYIRTAKDSSIAGYTDSVTVTVKAPGGLKTVSTSFRISAVSTPTNLYYFIADTEIDRIRMVDVETGIITTVAGCGSSLGPLGDEGPATAAAIDKPNGVWVDSGGTIYIADTNNDRIRMVDADPPHHIHTVAGGGSSTADGVPATEAELNGPEGVYVDSGGTIYIADTGNHYIRKVDADPPHHIHTVAGTGSKGDTGDEGPATAAKLNGPEGVYVDADGNIYIADSSNHCIRKVDADPPHHIHTVAGIIGSAGYTGDSGPATSAKLRTPGGVWADADGNIFIADTDNSWIRKVDAASPYNITRVAGKSDAGAPVGGYDEDGIPATDAMLNKQTGVYVDASGNIFISDRDNHRIRKVDAASPYNISTVAGNGVAGDAGSEAEVGDGGPATSANLNRPQGVYVVEAPGPPSSSSLEKVAELYWRFD